MNLVSPRRFVIALVIGLSLLLAAYVGMQMGRGSGDSGGGMGDRSASRDALIGGEFAVESGAVATAPAQGDSSQAADAAKAEQPMPSKVISTGNVTVSGADVAKLRAQAMAVVRETGGSVSAEETTADRKGGQTFSVLTIRVPSDRFDKTMTKLSELGRLVSANRSSEDVTTQVIDVEARVKVQAASVARIRDLLGRAKSIRDIVALENELAQRQSDLDSLRSQQKWLADQTDRSTITFTIDKTAKAAASDNPFLAGLQRGWEALSASFAALIAMLGALLPWLIVLVPLGLLARHWLRRTTKRSGPPSATEDPTST